MHTNFSLGKTKTTLARRHHAGFVLPEFKAISYKMCSFYLVIVESYKNTPALNEDSVLFSKDRNSIGKVSNN